MQEAPWETTKGLFFAEVCGRRFSLRKPSVQRSWLQFLQNSYGSTSSWLRICDEEVWSSTQQSSLYREQHQPVTSSVPAFFVTGEFDPRTPVRASTEAAVNFRNVKFGKSLVATGLSHGVSTRNPCMESITEAFLMNPDANISIECMKNQKPDFR